MVEHTSIRVTVEAKERAAESKGEHETWNEYIQRCTDNPPERRDYVAVDEIEFPDHVTLDASEHRAIAKAVAEVLGR